MRRIGFVLALTLSLMLAPYVAEAQQGTKAKTIGVLSLTSPDILAHLAKAGADALRELGWIPYSMTTLRPST